MKGTVMTQPRKATRIVQTPAVPSRRPRSVPYHAEPAKRTDGLLPGQKRRDQRQCPACHRWGCPVTGGTHYRTEGVYRYRACQGCGHVFVTVAPHGGGAERIDG